MKPHRKKKQGKKGKKEEKLLVIWQKNPRQTERQIAGQGVQWETETE